jgi:hypothetical protein
LYHCIVGGWQKTLKQYKITHSPLTKTNNKNEKGKQDTGGSCFVILATWEDGIRRIAIQGK